MSEFKDKKPAEEVDSDEEEETVQKPTAAEEAAAEPEEDTTLANPDVITKYQEAAKIAQAALLEVSKLCLPGAKISAICQAGDEFIEKKCSTIFNKKTKTGRVVTKGVAFPICCSVNELVCHCSPLTTEDFPPLVEGDLVKIDLGVHIDGFIAVAAHTQLVPNGPPTDNEVRKRVLCATYIGAEVAARMVKNGNTNAQVTAAMKTICSTYDVNAVAGTLMHQMKQFIVDGNKMILLREDPEQKVDACTFETGEAFAIDIAMSSGDGKPRETVHRTTVYKRAVDRKYILKSKVSRGFFNEVNRRFPTMPFTVRCFDDEKSAKMGVRECVTHQLLLPYPVLSERLLPDSSKPIIGHTKFTVLLLPNGTLQITGLPPVPFQEMMAAGKVPPELVEQVESGIVGAGNIGLFLAETLETESGKKLPEEILAILKDSGRPENKKKAKKSAKKKAAADAK